MQIFALGYPWDMLYPSSDQIKPINRTFRPTVAKEIIFWDVGGWVGDWI